MTKLFGTSGIRSKANTLVTPKLTLQVGQALATYAKAKTILTAQDTRTTSPMLQHALIAGITVEAKTRKTAEAIVKKAVKLIDKIIKETS